MNENTLIAIPAHNEAENIGRTIKSIKQTGFAGKIIVINDGSTDDTAKIAKINGAKVISFQKNQGKAAAIFAAFKEGIRRNCSALITFDADMIEIPKEDLKLIAGEAEKATANKKTLMIVASTRERSGFHWVSIDISGTRAYSRNALKKVLRSPDRGKVKGFGIEAFLNLELGERDTSANYMSNFVAREPLRVGERQSREIQQTLKALKKRILATNARRRIEREQRLKMQPPKTTPEHQELLRKLREKVEKEVKKAKKGKRTFFGA